jgi:RES domain-containing protein
MPEAWRIVKSRHADAAFSGEGAAKYGGRWNSRGVAVVYTSATKSLAVLESLVHLNPPVVFKYVAFHVEFDGALVETMPLTRLPANWRSEPPSRGTQKFGDVWVRESRSPVLEVPSVLIDGESNYILNPAHPAFKKISLSKPQPFAFDPRLV